MKKGKKRFLSGVLSAAMVLQTVLTDFPVDAFADAFRPKVESHTSVKDYIANHINSEFADEVSDMDMQKVDELSETFEVEVETSSAEEITEAETEKESPAEETVSETPKEIETDKGSEETESPVEETSSADIQIIIIETSPEVINSEASTDETAEIIVIDTPILQESEITTEDIIEDVNELTTEETLSEVVSEEQAEKSEIALEETISIDAVIEETEEIHYYAAPRANVVYLEADIQDEPEAAPEEIVEEEKEYVSNDELDDAIIIDETGKNGIGSTLHFVTLHYTLMDKAYATPGLTITEMYDKYPQSYIADFTSPEQIYLVEDGDYFVCLADIGRINGSEPAIFAQFSDGSIDYPVLYDNVMSYDYETGLLYIPKSFYYNEKGEEIAKPLAVQLLVPYNFGENNISEISVTTESEIKNLPVINKGEFKIKAQAFASMITIPLFNVETEADLRDIFVYVNEEVIPMALSEQNAFIDGEGSLNLLLNATNTHTLKVVVREHDELVGLDALNTDALLSFNGNVAELLSAPINLSVEVLSSNGKYIFDRFIVPGVKVETNSSALGKEFHYQSFASHNGVVSEPYKDELWHKVAIATAKYNMTGSAGNNTTNDPVNLLFNAIYSGTIKDVNDILATTKYGKLYYDDDAWAPSFSDPGWIYQLFLSLPVGEIDNPSGNKATWTVDMLNGVSGVGNGAGIAGYPNLKNQNTTYFNSATAGAKFQDKVVTNSVLAARCLNISVPAVEGGTSGASVAGTKADIYARCLYIDETKHQTVWSFLTPKGSNQSFGGIYAFQYELDNRDYYYQLGVKKVDDTNTSKNLNAVFAVSTESLAKAYNAADAAKSATDITSAKTIIGNLGVDTITTTTSGFGWSPIYSGVTSDSTPPTKVLYLAEAFVEKGFKKNPIVLEITMNTTFDDETTASSIKSVNYYTRNSDGTFTKTTKPSDISVLNGGVGKNGIQFGNEKYYGAFYLNKISALNNTTYPGGAVYVLISTPTNGFPDAKKNTIKEIAAATANDSSVTSANAYDKFVAKMYDEDTSMVQAGYVQGYFTTTSDASRSTLTYAPGSGDPSNTKHHAQESTDYILEGSKALNRNFLLIEVYSPSGYDLDENLYSFNFTSTKSFSTKPSYLDAAKNSTISSLSPSSGKIEIKTATDNNGTAIIAEDDEYLYARLGILKYSKDPLTGAQKPLPGITYNISASSNQETGKELKNVIYETKPTNKDGFVGFSVENLIHSQQNIASGNRTYCYTWNDTPNSKIWSSEDGETKTYYIQETQSSAEAAGVKWDKTIYIVTVTGKSERQGVAQDGGLIPSDCVKLFL